MNHHSCLAVFLSLFSITFGFAYSDFSEFENATPPKFSCAELRVLTLVDRGGLINFGKIVDAKTDAQRADIQNSDPSNTLKGVLKIENPNGLYAFNASENSLLNKYEMLLKYFSKNPFDNSEFRKYEKNPELALKSVDYEKLLDKLNTYLGTEKQPMLYYYTPPGLRPKEVKENADGSLDLKVSEFNFLRGYAVDELLNMDLERKLPQIYSQDKTSKVLAQRDRLLNSDFLAGEELDCNQPRPEFTRLRLLARAEALEKSGRSEEESKELSSLKRYFVLEKLFLEYLKQKDSSSLESLRASGKVATTEQIAEYKKLQTLADSYYDQSCKAIDLAKAKGYYAAYSPKLMVVDFSSVDYMEERGNCENYALGHGIALLSKYPFDKNATKVYPHKLNPDSSATLDGKVLSNAEGYNWHNDEITHHPFDGVVKDLSRDVFIAENLSYETGIGRETYIVSTFDLGGKKFTMVGAHLEAYCTPNYRRLQIREILNTIKGVDNPVLMTGDMNTTSYDGRNWTIGRIFRNYLRNKIAMGSEGFDGMGVIAKAENFVLKLASLIPIIGNGLSFVELQQGINMRHDPTLDYSGEYSLFEDLFKNGFGQFRYSYGVDDLIPVIPALPLIRTFPGVAYLQNIPGPIGLFKRFKKTLEESNERTNYGFRTSFTMDRPDLNRIVEGKLDWFWPRNGKDSQLETSKPEVMYDLDYAYKDMGAVTFASGRISDHFPNAVDIKLKAIK